MKHSLLRTLLRTLSLLKTFTGAPSKNPSKKHLPLKNLLRTLLRSVRLHDPLGVRPRKDQGSYAIKVCEVPSLQKGKDCVRHTAPHFMLPDFSHRRFQISNRIPNQISPKTSQTHFCRLEIRQKICRKIRHRICHRNKHLPAALTA